MASSASVSEVEGTTAIAVLRTSSRMRGPDHLRALAILLVMLWHVPRSAVTGVALSIRDFSWAGVDLFFVLSGFLIGTQLLTPVAAGERPSARHFYLRRALRILPAYWVVLAIFIFLPVTREAPDMAPVWRFLTFTMNFDLDFRKTGAFTQAWSLCVEEHFYLTLPLVVLALRRSRSILPVVALAIAVLLGGMAARAVIWQMEVGGPLSTDTYYSPTYLREIYYPTYCRLDGLLCGVMLAAVWVFRNDQWRRWAPPHVKLGIGAAAVILGLILFADRTGVPNDYWMPALSLAGAVFGYPVFALGVAFVLAALLEFEPWLQRWYIPGAATLATLSYSLYLTHKSVMSLDRAWLGADHLQGLFGMAVYLTTSVIVAGVLYLLVERPFIMLRRRLA